MLINSKNIKNGILDSKFGGNNHEINSLTKGVINSSFHIVWSNLKKESKYINIIFIDYDSNPVCSFSWIHWMVADVNVNLNELKENSSNENKEMIQGSNSWSSPFLDSDKHSIIESSNFGGCYPPDKDHTYTLKVYATSEKTNLKQGFFMNEFLDSIKNILIEEAKLNFIYKKIEG